MTRTEPTVVTPTTLRDWPLPDPSGGKDARGRLLVVGGTVATPGAVVLAAEAALRAGAGKLALATVAPSVATIGVRVVEASVAGLPQTAAGNISPQAAEEVATRAEDADVLLIGPGFSDPKESVRLLAAAMPGISTPIVLDALASAFLTDHPEGLYHLGGRAVLTANLTELAHTAGVEEEEVSADPLRYALDVARRCRVVVVSGAEHTFIATPRGRSWVVEGGGPGLSVSGSGDAQAGIVSGVLVRGAEPAQAAVYGAYLHSRAGERLAASVGVLGYLAREIPAQVPRIMAEIE